MIFTKQSIRTLALYPYFDHDVVYYTAIRLENVYEDRNLLAEKPFEKAIDQHRKPSTQHSNFE